MTIPFVDLRAQYQAHKSELDTAIASVVADCAFIGGSNNKYVRGFEQAFASWLGVDDFISCANGTDAIEILLQAAGIGPGDEVIVPALTWISTSEAVTTAGATPVFVDVDPATANIEPAGIEHALTPRTKAIIAVHLYGQPADMDAIMAIADQHDLFVLEDSAQAHGARYAGRRAGTIGHAASFSFYPGKNLGAYGDAGGMYAKDPQIAERARMIANHGQQRKHEHMFEGRNSRMDGIQAAVLSCKLGYLDDWVAARQQAAADYDRALAQAVPAIGRPAVASGCQHAYHLYVVRLSGRDALAAHLAGKGIGCGVHYPTPLPLLPAYRRMGHAAGDFPVAEQTCASILSLPIFPELTTEQVESVVAEVAAFTGDRDEAPATSAEQPRARAS